MIWKPVCSYIHTIPIPLDFQHGEPYKPRLQLIGPESAFSSKPSTLQVQTAQNHSPRQISTVTWLLVPEQQEAPQNGASYHQPQNNCWLTPDLPFTSNCRIFHPEGWQQPNSGQDAGFAYKQPHPSWPSLLMVLELHFSLAIERQPSKDYINI